MPTSLDLTGRLAFVTGAARGIGAAVCHAFADAGAIAFATDIRPGKGIVACDVADEASVRRAFDAAAAQGEVTDVVHAAGIVAVGPVVDLTVAELRRVLDVNLIGSFIVAREAALRLPDGGSITLLASQAGLRGGALWSAYCASKAGVNRLAECLAQELGPRQIRVNALCPGIVDTPMQAEAIADLAKRTSDEPADIAERYRRGIPLGRFAEPREIAALCVLLASPLASYLSGIKLVADGGELT